MLVTPTPEAQFGKKWAKGSFTGEQPDRHCPSQASKVTISSVSHGGHVYPWWGVMRMVHVVSPKANNPRLMMTKKSDIQRGNRAPEYRASTPVDSPCHQSQGKPEKLSPTRPLHTPGIPGGILEKGKDIRHKLRKYKQTKDFCE